MHYTKKILTLFLLVPVISTFSGCKKTVHTHGQILSEKQLNALQIGKDDRRKVMRTLGSPSTVSTFGDKTWYYLTEITVDDPLKPNQLQTRKVVVVRFNESGKLAAVETKDKTNARDIKINERATKTQGQSLGVVDQVIENIGTGF